MRFTRDSVSCWLGPRTNARGPLDSTTILYTNNNDRNGDKTKGIAKLRPKCASHGDLTAIDNDVLVGDYLVVESQ